MASSTPLDTSLNHEHESCLGRLKAYREAVGIIDTLGSAAKEPKGSASNAPVYRQILKAEKRARLQYYAAAFLISSCLILQIMVAIAVTSLGAANGSRTAITGLGAVNTVIACLLAFFRGRGVPISSKHHQNSLRKVRKKDPLFILTCTDECLYDLTLQSVGA